MSTGSRTTTYLSFKKLDHFFGSLFSCRSFYGRFFVERLTVGDLEPVDLVSVGFWYLPFVRKTAQWPSIHLAHEKLS